MSLTTLFLDQPWLSRPGPTAARWAVATAVLLGLCACGDDTATLADLSAAVDPADGAPPERPGTETDTAPAGQDAGPPTVETPPPPSPGPEAQDDAGPPPGPAGQGLDPEDLEGRWACEAVETWRVDGVQTTPREFFTLMDVSQPDAAQFVAQLEQDRISECELRYDQRGFEGSLQDGACELQPASGSLNVGEQSLTLSVIINRGDRAQIEYELTCVPLTTGVPLPFLVELSAGSLATVTWDEASGNAVGQQPCTGGAPCSLRVPMGAAVQVESQHSAGPPVVRASGSLTRDDCTVTDDTAMTCTFTMTEASSLAVQWPFTGPQFTLEVDATLGSIQLSFEQDGESVHRSCAGTCSYRVDARTHGSASFGNHLLAVWTGSGGHTCSFDGGPWSCGFRMDSDRTITLEER